MTMEAEDAHEFFKNVSQGTKKYKEVDLERKSGKQLKGVEMHPVSKIELAEVIEKLPNEMLEGGDADTTDEAEDMLDDVESAEDLIDEEAVQEDSGGSGLETITTGAIEGFEGLCKDSLEHEDLSPPEMSTVIDNFSFEVLFGLGTVIISLSIEEMGDIQNFHVRE
jgi:hypothetical protein